ncbi:MAG: shikimate dehydrogenase [Gammaproteobacteria bacterium]|nr:shikimate dehydrogenase [Gammaproteobacteria bacterium]|tara:strand:+ start:25119 stop:25934 length:816 start_codon:yes stop_codon:yes gene_type:complete
MSKVYKLGVIGNPIEHSLSPFIHSRFSRNENINIEYLPYKVKEQDFDLFIKEFFSDKNSKGLNITLPHKKKAAEIAGTISKEAKYINAVNTILKSDKELLLYSTDGIGFINDMDNKKFKFKDKKILIIGAGAAVESVLYRVAQSGVDHITVLNRTMEKANRLIRKFSNMTSINSDLSEEKPYDLIINGSSAGLTGEFKPIDDIFTHKRTHFYDLNYSLAETPFCKWAKDRSSFVDDGMGMLVYQAAHSFEKWFKVFPETKSVIQDLYGMRE